MVKPQIATPMGGPNVADIYGLCAPKKLAIFAARREFV